MLIICIFMYFFTHAFMYVNSLYIYVWKWHTLESILWIVNTSFTLKIIHCYVKFVLLTSLDSLCLSCYVCAN